MGLSYLLTKLRELITKRRSVKVVEKLLISLDSNPVPVGLFKTFTAGASVSAGQVVSLASDGKVYPSSSTYPNIVGVALDTVVAGGSVRVLVFGVAKVVADGTINPGDVVTFSSATAGRVVRYTGHSHTVSTTTSTAVTGVTVSTGSFVTGISVDRRDFTTSSVVTGVSVATGSFVTGISVDRRDFTTASAVTGISTSTGSFVISVDIDNPYYQDAYGYLRHSHSAITGYAITSISTSTGVFVTGITSTAGTTVVANVSASTGTAVTSVSTSTGTCVTGITSTAGTTVVANVSASTGSAVTGVSTSTGSFVTGVSIGASLSRVLGIALTGASAAGTEILVLVAPKWL
jgi:hypothetical protein